MFTGSKSHLPPQIFLFLSFFLGFWLVNLQVDSFFFVLLLGNDDSFWSSEWPLFWPFLTCPFSDWGRQDLPRTQAPGYYAVLTSTVQVGQLDNWTYFSLLKFLGVLLLLHFPAVSKWWPWQISAFLTAHAPGCDGNIPNWKQLTCPDLPAFGFPIQYFGTLIFYHYFLARWLPSATGIPWAAVWVNIWTWPSLAQLWTPALPLVSKFPTVSEPAESCFAVSSGMIILEQSQLGFIGVRPLQLLWAPHSVKPVLGLILCFCCLEIFNNFWIKFQNFYFALGSITL